jgi:hypothetical protein
MRADANIARNLPWLAHQLRMRSKILKRRPRPKAAPTAKQSVPKSHAGCSGLLGDFRVQYYLKKKYVNHEST